MTKQQFRRRDPYIMPHERRVLTLRQHPLVSLGRHAGLLALAFAVAGWLTVASQLIWWVPWILVLAATGNLSWRLLYWSMTYLIVSNLRILVIDIDGIFTRRVSMVPLVKVVDMSFERSLAGSFLNYGRLVVESAHAGHPLRRIGALPHIDTVYAIVCSMIFSDPEGQAEENTS